jgi:hypothetical protein
MSYQDEIKKHFENKKSSLFEQTIEDGKWRNGEKKYPHILPKELEKLNLLPTYRNTLNNYLESNKSKLKKHIYFHHLNSSQAMCLNFFFLFLKKKNLN